MKLNRSIFLSLFLLTGFFVFSQSGVTTVDSIMSGGLQRKFRIYVPPSYNASNPAPLVLNLHGYTSNALQQQLYSNFIPVADTAGFIMIYPDGTSSFGGPFWNAGITTAPDDVKFISDLIDYAEQAYNINFKRVYSCGMSNGGIMSYYLACNLQNRITAIASVTGSMFNAWLDVCSPSRAVPVMEIHGTMDATVPYQGDQNFSPIDSVIQKWVKHNNCNTSPVTFSVPNISTSDNSTVVNYKYKGGDNGSTVELYKVFGGSHSWPGAIALFPNTNQDFNASAQIWRFFRQYTLDQFVTNVSVHELSLEPGIRVYPNPASTILSVYGINDASLSVKSIGGVCMLKKESAQTIDISALQPGIYFLEIRKDNLSRVVKFIRE